MVGMRRLCLAGAALAAAASFAAPAHAITNGSVDGTAHPNVGALYATAQGHPVPTLFCSGSLIAPGVFLTAAHCVDAIAAAPNPHYFVSFAPAPNPSTLIEGTPFEDPLFGTAKGPREPHDIAVIRFDPLAPGAAGIAPVRLAPLGFLDALLRGRPTDDGGDDRADARGRALGFAAAAPAAMRRVAGSGSARGGRDELFFLDVGYGLTDITAARDGIRRDALSGDPKLKGDAWLVLSQVAAKGFGGTCTGDSGGPQFFGDVQVSITITGDADCVKRGVNLRLDTPAVRGFLAPFLAR